jgi:DIS3-like exonuclease 1
MTYDQADRILMGLPPEEPSTPSPPPLTAGSPVAPGLTSVIRDDLSILTQLARLRRKLREEVGGAVDLSSGDLGNELKFTLVNNQPVKVVPKADKEIHNTIAELMIMANSFVAETISKKFPESSLLRVHRTVAEDRFEDLKTVLDAGGIAFDGRDNMSLAQSLKAAERTNEGGSVVNALFKSLATRAMSEALYVCTGDPDLVSGLSHYGLGLQRYCHFTRYVQPRITVWLCV